jgi:hypothetical protein
VNYKSPSSYLKIFELVLIRGIQDGPDQNYQIEIFLILFFRNNCLEVEMVKTG